MGSICYIGTILTNLHGSMHPSDRLSRDTHITLCLPAQFLSYYSFPIPTYYAHIVGCSTTYFMALQNRARLSLLLKHALSEVRVHTHSSLDNYAIQKSPGPFHNPNNYASCFDTPKAMWAYCWCPYSMLRDCSYRLMH